MSLTAIGSVAAQATQATPPKSGSGDTFRQVFAHADATRPHGHRQSTQQAPDTSTTHPAAQDVRALVGDVFGPLGGQSTDALAAQKAYAARAG